MTYNSFSLAQVSLFQRAAEMFLWRQLGEVDRQRTPKVLAQLSHGDKLLGFDGSKLLYSEMILMLDSNPQVEGKLMIMLNIDSEWPAINDYFV